MIRIEQAFKLLGVQRQTVQKADSLTTLTQPCFTKNGRDLVPYVLSLFPSGTAVDVHNNCETLVQKSVAHKKIYIVIEFGR